MSGDVLTIIDHGEHGATAIRGGERVKVPLWIVEMVNCGFTGDHDRLTELYHEHVRSSADLVPVIDFAHVVTGLSRKVVNETMQKIVRQRRH